MNRGVCYYFHSYNNRHPSPTMKTTTRETFSMETLSLMAGLTTALTVVYFFAASLFA